VADPAGEGLPHGEGLADGGGFPHGGQRLSFGGERVADGLAGGAEAVSGGMAGLRAQADRIAGGLAGAIEELREIARGIQPAVLTGSGLRAALRTLARRSALPVEVDVDLPRRPPADVESAAYYFTAEAITNTIKHARAGWVTVSVSVVDGELRVTVTDDGIGGADGGAGSGLVGLRDRIEAAGGRMSVHSPPGGGTTLTALLPFDGVPGSR
jgi:signal transduction histidine kinase